MKIGLLGVEDPRSVRSFSGIPYHLYNFLRRAGHDVQICGPYPLHIPFRARALNRLLHVTSGKHVVIERHPSVSKQYAAVVDRYAEMYPDLDLFLATSVFYANRHRSRIPIVAWGDTTAAGVLGTYPYYSNITKRMIEDCHKVEQCGLDICDLVIFSNHWAATVALEHYKIPAEKVRVITFGAGLLQSPDRTEIQTIISSRDSGALNVLLVGVHWQRKGVDKAIHIIGELRRRGIDVTLKVVGCSTPPHERPPEYVEVLGRIPKDSPDGQRRFAELFRSAHAFLLPTIAECAAVSLVEANAYGLPVITSAVGGNGSLVSDGINGHLCSLDAPPSVWADALVKVIGDAKGYRNQCLRAYDYYEKELSWEVAVARFEQLVQSTFGLGGDNL